MTPLLGILLTVILLLSLLAGARTLQVRANLSPEAARKVMHIGMGVMALSFPWVLQENWAVLVICVLTITVLLGLRRVKLLRQQVGGVLHDVERRSGGDVYFLLAVAGLFLLARGDWVLYVVPLLVLTFADGLAALTGVSYGRRKYLGADGFKSLEGSVAFATVTFLVTHVPLLLFTSIGRAESLVVAALVALLAMLVEAISWEGIDNVLVPLSTFIALDGYRQAPLSLQLEHLAVMALLTLVVFVLRRRMPLTAGALAAAALGLYLCLTLGDWRWLVAPLTTALAGALLYRCKSGTPGEPDQSSGYGVQVIVSLAAPGLVWLLTARYLGRPQDFFAFTLCWAAQLAGLASFARQYDHVDAPMHPVQPTQLAYGLGLASALILLPWAALQGARPADWQLALQGAFVVLAVLTLCAVLAAQNRLTFQWQMTVLGLAGLGGFLLLG